MSGFQYLLALLLAFSCGPSPAAAQLVTYPATVELDVVFPRNETYAPAPVFPIVLAVQNLPAVTVSSYVELEWGIYKRAGSGERRVAFGWVESADLGRVNSSIEPYYIIDWTDKFNNTESAGGTYSLAWRLAYKKCTQEDFGLSSGWRFPSKGTIFTVAAGGNQPDFGADRDTCPAAAHTFEITTTVPIINPMWFGDGGRNVCASIPELPPPANPCGARINDAVASSISAELTASACATSPPVLTSGCPPSTTETNSGSRVVLAGNFEMGLTGMLSFMWASVGALLFVL